MTRGKPDIFAPFAARRAASAFTLVEVLLAMGILAIGLAAVASIYPVAVLQQRRAMDDLNGTMIGQNVLATLQVLGRDAFPPTASAEFVVMDQILLVDGVVQGNTLTSASDAVDFASVLTAGSFHVICVNNRGSFQAPVTAATATTLTLDNSPAILIPDNSPGNPANDVYLVKVIGRSLGTAPTLPWVPTEPVDRGVIASNSHVAVRRMGYDYFVAYRRQTAADPAEVVIFVARRISPTQQGTVAELRTGGNDKQFSAVPQLEQLTGPGLGIAPDGTVTGLPARPPHEPPPLATAEHWSNEMFWADDRNQMVFLYDTGAIGQSGTYRMIAKGVVDIEPAATITYDRLLYLPQGAIGVTTGVVQ